MEDIAFADVLPLFEQWCYTDMTRAELIDSGLYLSEQLAEMQAYRDADVALIWQQAGDLHTCREEIHRQARRYALCQQRYEAALLRCANLTHDVTTCRVIAFLACCAALATWLRIGGVQ